MDLRPHAVVLVFHLGFFDHRHTALALLGNFYREALQRLFHRFHRAGQHKAERVEQLHARFCQAPAGRQLQNFGQVAVQHPSRANLGDWSVIGGRQSPLPPGSL